MVRRGKLIGMYSKGGFVFGLVRFANDRYYKHTSAILWRRNAGRGVRRKSLKGPEVAA